MKTLKRSELKAMRTPKSIPVGASFSWEVTLCRHRGTYRVRNAKVQEVMGMNILTDEGDYLYWTDLKQYENVTCTFEEKTDGKLKPKIDQ